MSGMELLEIIASADPEAVLAKCPGGQSCCPYAYGTWCPRRLTIEAEDEE